MKLKNSNKLTYSKRDENGYVEIKTNGEKSCKLSVFTKEQSNYIDKIKKEIENGK